MAYVRKRGNQLAIVHGERDPETGKVQQRTLFTIYSKAEAVEAIGRGSELGARQLRAYLEARFPSLELDWKKAIALTRIDPGLLTSADPPPSSQQPGKEG